MILLKSNSRFLLPLPAREPFHYGWSTASTEDSDNTLRYFLETLCPLPLQFPTTKISLWINTYTCHSYFYSQSILLIQNTPRILCAYCLAVLCHLNTPTNSYSHLSSIRSSPNDSCITQSLRNTIRSFKNPQQPIALEILVCLHYG